MKSLYSVLFLLCGFAFSANAQKITLDPSYYLANFEDQDLTDNALDLEAHISVTNNTEDTINLIWTRIVTEECPTEWDTQICDNNLCYFYTIESNVSDITGLDAPFKLGADEMFDGFILHVLPRGVPGCCRVKVEFATVEEPEVLLETAVFDVSVNTDNCNFGTSTQEIAEAQLVSVYPNPTTDEFTLSNNDVVNQVDIYNSLGQKLKTFDFVNGEYHNISDLNTGLYSLVLKNAEGKTLHTLMLDKI